jgi:uncharacterized FlgJ-related protein
VPHKGRRKFTLKIIHKYLMVLNIAIFPMASNVTALNETHNEMKVVHPSSVKKPSFRLKIRQWANVINNEIEKERHILQFREFYDKKLVSPLLKKYGLTKINSPKLDDEIRKRVQPIPIEIVIAQSTIESNGGRSRFAHEAHNYFGMWTFNKSVPHIKLKQRDNGIIPRIRKFKSGLDSLRSYSELLNSGRMYYQFRELRDKGVTPFVLARGLLPYSEERMLYVEKIQAKISEL